MTSANNSANEFIKDRVKLSSVCEALGIKTWNGRAKATWRDGERDSVALDEEKGIWCDHGNGDEGGDIFALVQRVKGCDFATARRWLVEQFHLEQPRGRSNEYVYTDANGVPAFCVIRKVPKSFVQARFDKKGKKVFNMDGVRRFPFHLPRLIEGVATGANVFIAEGEKDVENLEKLDLVATTNPGGAGKWLDEYSTFFKGAKRVVIIADRDGAEKNFPGQRHAEKVRDSLERVAGVKASVVYVRDESCKDASDWIAKGASAEDFADLAKNPPKWLPPWQTDVGNAFEALFARRKKLCDFADPVPDERNENAIFKDRYLRRGQLLLIVSTLGVGKSTFVSQGSECWARGLAFQGFVPVGPLSVGVFETEDDDDEVADFRNNFAKGFRKEGWTELEIADAEGGEHAPVYYDVKGVDTSNFLDYLEYCVSRNHHDVVIINPAYDFIKGDFSKAEDVHEWKTRLLALATKYRFAVILVHHTNKVPANAKERDAWCTGTSAAYAGSGSMVLPSSARAVVFIRPLEKKSGVFEINAAKRGKRLGWRDGDGNATTIRYAAHSDGFIFWRDATPGEIALVAPKKKNAEGGEILSAGVQRIIDICKERGRPFDSVADLRREVMAKYEVSDTAADNWLNKAIDAKRCRKLPLEESQKVLVGLTEQFGDEDDED